MTRVRIWDLPTRLFHWSLAVCVVGSLVTAKVGGNWMTWHLWLGHAVLALLLFRVIWGVFGGYWSRWRRLVCTPAALISQWAGRSPVEHRAGHTPLGALSVVAMLVTLGAQGGTGLVSDDEIAFFGPLVRFVSGDTVQAATAFHKNVGEYLVFGMVGLHLLAIGIYQFWRREGLVRAMVDGDKTLSAPVQPSQDGVGAWLRAALIMAACVGAVWWIAGLSAF